MVHHLGTLYKVRTKVVFFKDLGQKGGGGGLATCVCTSEQAGNYCVSGLRVEKNQQREEEEEEIQAEQGTENRRQRVKASTSQQQRTRHK